MLNTIFVKLTLAFIAPAGVIPGNSTGVVQVNCSKILSVEKQLPNLYSTVYLDNPGKLMFVNVTETPDQVISLCNGGLKQ